MTGSSFKEEAFTLENKEKESIDGCDSTGLANPCGVDPDPDPTLENKSGSGLSWRLGQSPVFLNIIY